MAISWMQTEWLSSLALRSQIPPGAAVLDLGTQDLWAEPEPLGLVAARHLEPADCGRAMAAIFDGRTPKLRSQRDFYSLFGASSYRSIDLCDSRADFRIDLNTPIPAAIGTYDIVTNFGTTEHIFNINQAFANIHALLNVGGVQLHTLPVHGAVDHGFHNLHPCAYLDLAKANAYDVVDLHYVDNIYVRTARPIQAAPFDFGTLPIQRQDMSDMYSLSRKIALQFHRNLESEETRAALERVPPATPLEAIVMPDERLPIFLVFDYLFVALRKTSASPASFVTPTQGIYAMKPAATPSEPQKGFWRGLLRWM